MAEDPSVRRSKTAVAVGRRLWRVDERYEEVLRCDALWRCFRPVAEAVPVVDVDGDRSRSRSKEIVADGRRLINSAIPVA